MESILFLSSASTLPINSTAGPHVQRRQWFQFSFIYFE